MHVDEEQLQRLVDDELDTLADPGSDWVREHMVYCDVCRERLAHASADQSELFALLGTLDHPRPRIDHATIVARGRAGRWSWMKKAAGFVVVAALAGAAYAAPGSPLPSMVERVFKSRTNESPTPISQTTIPERPPVSGVTVAAGNRMVIQFTTPRADRALHVKLSDNAEIEVRATGVGASFTAGEKVLTVNNSIADADFEISIPRRAPNVAIRIDGREVFLKDGTRITTDNPATGDSSYIISLGAVR